MLEISQNAEISLGPTGNVIEGSYWDCNKRHFERMLKDYDPLLYVKWSPRKLGGWGCWEIRRRPERKQVVDVTQDPSKEFTIVRLEYHENDILNHVLDVRFLHYSQIDKIRSMDTWNKDHMIHDEEYHMQKLKEKEISTMEDEFKHAVKENRKAIHQFMDLVNSGKSAGEVLTRNFKYKSKR